MVRVAHFFDSQCTSDVLTNRSDIHHRLAMLSRFCDSGDKTPNLHICWEVQRIEWPTVIHESTVRRVEGATA